MSDYLGPNQTRVLDSQDRNFESITYQKRKPPLSSEVNLGGKIEAERTRQAMQYLIPSGWSRIGQIRDSILETACEYGDVLCSPTFARNTFKLIALDKGVNSEKNTAWVNGWQILVQGSNSSNENNIIVLPDPPSVGTRIDFIFLEVWRKLIYPSDVIYKYGNLLYGGTNWTNDLVDPAMGIETSLRIQLQYRIRVAPADLDGYPDGFDPNLVFVQGPLPNPLSTSSHSYFSPLIGDIGAWYAEDGSDIDQTVLQTVDGYTYAIPMFAVRRRNTGSYNPDLRSNGAGKSLTDYNNGYASDRPDNLYNDWIVADDILDMRHRVLSGENLRMVCEDAFKKLLDNDNRSKMTKISLGEDSYGVSLTQVDAVSNVDHAGSVKIAQGDSARRVFSNAQTTQPDTFAIRTVAQKSAGIQNTNWISSDQIQISMSGYPTGTTVASIQQVYTKESGAFVGYTPTGVGTSTVTITVGSAAPPVGTSYPIIVEYTISYSAGPNGFTEVPIAFLEARKEDSSSSIALQDQDIRVRTAPPVIANDGTHFSMLQYRGGRTTENCNFGHQMIYHVLGNGTQIITVPRSLYGYQILGIMSVHVTGELNPRGTPLISRDSTTYTIDMGSPSVLTGVDIAVTLYTGVKMFDVNKQGRGIIDCFEMKEIIPDETATGSNTTFHINGGSNKLLGLGSYISANGAGFAYVNGTRKVLETMNRGLPYDSTKTYGTIQFSIGDTPSAGATIEVPVLLKSAISSTEGYSFFYQTIPYQGLLDTSATGTIEAVGSSIITTAGSGMMTDYTYASGSVTLGNTASVNGVGTSWLSTVRPGYILKASADSTKEYTINQVYSDTLLSLTTIPDRTSLVAESYTIVAKDQPYFSQINIVDRLPTYNALNDASALNTPISTAISDPYPILETRVISNVQDIAGMPSGSVWIGLNSADRGRSTINIPGSVLDLGNGSGCNLGLKFEKLSSSGNYKKVYQSYILNKDNSGQLYLMVVGSETDNTSASSYLNPASPLDSVDIFELPGRPLIMGRVF